MDSFKKLDMVEDLDGDMSDDEAAQAMKRYTKITKALATLRSSRCSGVPSRSLEAIVLWLSSSSR